MVDVMDTYFAKFDQAGSPVGFYPSDVWPEEVRPLGCVELSGDQYREFIDNPGRRIWHNGAVEIFEPAPVPVDLLAYAKDASWQKEVGGIVFAGIPIATDDRSKLMIAGARIDAQSDPNWNTNWDAADDTTHIIDAATMIAISQAVSAHVNYCFAIRAAVKAAIANGSITTTAQIDAAFA